MRRATVLALWQAAPWVLFVLVATSLVGIGHSARFTWSTLQRGATVISAGDGGAAGFAGFLAGVVAVPGWARTVRAAVPVLVAGGITRRAAAGGVLIGVVALAAVATALLAAATLAGAAVQRAVVRSFPALPAPSGSDAYASSLTLTLDAPTEVFNPVETFAWILVLALGGALVGAARYRWRARGVAVVLAAAVVPWAAYLSLVVGMGLDGTIPEGAPSAAGSPLAAVAACPVLAAAVWLVLRRGPLGPPAR